MPAAGPKLPFPLAEADLCVKCGLCLPHCPTYLDSRQEGDSPRGRIALMQGLATGQLQMTPRLEMHLDGCLACRACERVCPAKVPYGSLLDAGRALMGRAQPRRLRTTAALSMVLTSGGLRRSLALLLWLYQRSGLQALLRGTRLLGRSRLARLESLLPSLPFPRSMRLAAAAGGTWVELFVGCVGDIAERAVAEDAARLLAACGVQARINPGQTCCGAIDQHGGRTAAAAALAQRNLGALAGEAPVLALASGCAATLLDYPLLVPGAAARGFAKRVRDPGRFLLEHGAALRFKPLRARAALHLPCTLRNAVGEITAWKTLLQRIPELELVELAPRTECCGAAGAYFVERPEAADRMLEPKLAAARELAPDLVLSPNVGCSLHLAAGLRREGLRTEVLHPLRLLARQLA
jgi:glycolate dehydrogenase iron-sulfur subunit